jgi:hypothetical protein
MRPKGNHHIESLRDITKGICEGETRHRMTATAVQQRVLSASVRELI